MMWPSCRRLPLEIFSKKFLFDQKGEVYRLRRNNLKRNRRQKFRGWWPKKCHKHNKLLFFEKKRKREAKHFFNLLAKKCRKRFCNFLKVCLIWKSVTFAWPKRGRSRLRKSVKEYWFDYYIKLVLFFQNGSPSRVFSNYFFIKVKQEILLNILLLCLVSMALSLT